jgi:hypothetical protein
MKPLSDPEFDKIFREYLLRFFPDAHILDYDLDEIAWFLDNGTADTRDGQIWFVGRIMDPKSSYRCTSEQQGYLAFIIKELNSGQYRFERLGDDLLVKSGDYIVKTTIEGYFDETQQRTRTSKDPKTQTPMGSLPLGLYEPAVEIEESTLVEGRM